MQCPAHTAESSATSKCPVDTVEGNATPDDSPDANIDHSKMLPIPSPPHQHYFGLVGHLADLDAVLPVRTYWQLMDKYAPIFQLDLGMTYPRVFVGSRELVNEMADDSRFIKFTHRLHQEMRAVFGDGLFSAESTSKAWNKAHRLLVPALGPVGLSKMFDDMQDIAAQLVLKWDRYGPDHEIELIEDMSRLTFDTIGLCAYGYRFNEFYSEDPHPFQKELKEAIVESGRRANRPDVLNRYYYYKDEQHRQENIVKIRDLCRRIVQDRIDNPKPDANDLLNVMIHGVDRETGETMGFENVLYQIPTLLGGGYETTSSTLSFIYYYLCSKPETLRKAQAEVDEIVGDSVVTYDMLRKLKYLDACMKEALRMQHPVSLLTRFSTRDTVLGGKYFIKKGQMVSGIWRHFHRDPNVWGADADEFRPERMLDAEFEKMPPNAWKPFGDGLRACIGRGFAEQEMLICMAMVLQKFNLEKVDPDYELKLTGQMGVKPVNLKIRARRRPGRTLTLGIPGGGVPEQADKALITPGKVEPARLNGVGSSSGPRRAISILFGGNQGTCESLVQSLCRTAPGFGLEVVDIRDLDSAIESLPTDRPCVIITPSYEGRPPYNAIKFVNWLEKMAKAGEKLPAGVNFTVFGAGNSDWVHTFHKVPRLIDEKLEQLGAERIFEPGFANVKRDLLGPWEVWSEKLCVSLSGTASQAQPEQVGVDIHIESNKSQTTHQLLEGELMQTGVVTVNRELSAASSLGNSKRHIEVRLPAGCSYRTGDYLVVHGQNPDEVISRIINRFGLSAQDLMVVRSSNKSFLPTQPIAIEHFLRHSVELAVPITQRQLGTLIAAADEGSEEFTQLKKMQSDKTYQTLLDLRYSVIDVLEEVPGLKLPFGVYVDMLLPLTPRLFSISSTPLAPGSTSGGCPVASLTFDVFEAPATSGHGVFHGVASSYLAARVPGNTIQCLVRPTKVRFQLPTSLETPVVMLAAGSGIAPMRAFVQERSIAKKTGKGSLGPALLLFGCRHPDKDYLYRSELELWEKEEVVETVPCFSRPDEPQGARYVPDMMWEMRDRLWGLLQDGARIYICGSAGRLGRSCGETWRRIWMEKTGKGPDEAFEWFEKFKNDQYISDYITEEVKIMATQIEFPLIDLAPYLNPSSPDDVARVVSEVREACKNFGFFQVKGHGISMEEQKSLLKALKEFFSLPREEKIKLSFLNNKGRRGYEESGMTLRKGDALPDAKEAFYIGREEPVIIPPGFHCPNVWPDLPAEKFHDPVWSYYEATGKLGRTIWEILLLGLGRDPAIINQFATRPIVQMKMIRYPAFSTTAPGQFGVGPHTDFGGVTVLLQQAGKDGLEVFHEQTDQWLPVPATEDVYIINCGDMIQSWSGGIYRSAKHRVINKADGERLSCATFWHGDVDATNPLNPDDPNKDTIGKLLVKRFGSQFSLPKEIEAQT
ncbi:bifunctional p-450 nadph-p450 reductase [Paramyrothecium foliicola]|nr:bifunctional p-450 nadph-p450 reductase [Paramyrothecium foliicola]